MLFAAVDWAKYIFQVGRYSPDALRQAGAIHATPEIYQSIVGSAALGDSFFVHSTRSTISWAIMYLTHGPWNHVGILVSPETVFEAITTGVGEYPLKKYFNRRNYISFLRLPLSDGQRKGIKQFAADTVGSPYGYRKIVWLFLLKITNADPDYRLRFSIDILVALGLAVLLIPFRPIQVFCLALASAYLIVLAIHSFRRLRAALRLHRDYLETASSMFNAPHRTSPNRLYRRILREPSVQIAETFTHDEN